MNENVFEIGEEVQHRAGIGRKMIIIQVTGREAVCEWSDETGPRQQTFALAALERHRPRARLPHTRANGMTV